MKHNFSFVLCVIFICILCSKSMGSVETNLVRKSLSVKGKSCILAAKYIPAQSVLQIYDITNASKKKRNIASIRNCSIDSSCCIDFDISNDGDILWVMIQRKAKGLRRRGIYIYPLVKDREEKSEKYIPLAVRRDVNEKDARFDFNSISYLNLTRRLQQYAVERWRRGEPLSLGRNSKISNVRIECTENGIIVGGSLGNYTFTGKIGIGENNRLWTKDFKFTEIESHRQPSTNITSGNQGQRRLKTEAGGIKH